MRESSTEKIDRLARENVKLRFLSLIFLETLQDRLLPNETYKERLEYLLNIVDEKAALDKVYKHA